MHFCKNGVKSNKEAWWVNDGRGIPLCKVCEDCEEQQLSKYRPEILGHYTEADVDEAIDPDYDYSDVYDY